MLIPKRKRTLPPAPAYFFCRRGNRPRLQGRFIIFIFHTGETFLEVGGQRTLHRDFNSADRMRKSQFASMQHKAASTLGSVEVITKDGQSAFGKMNSNLVGPAGLWHRLDPISTRMLFNKTK